MKRIAAIMAAATGAVFAASIAIAQAETAGIDKDFAAKAAQAGMAEVAEARIALKNSTRPDVKDFARRMIADHTKAGDQLKTIASTEGLALPGQPSAEDQLALTKLGALSGADFDRAYIQGQIDAHDSAVGLFTKESERGTGSFRSFASATLPTLQDHSRMIKALPIH